MSLRSEPISVVPEKTVRVARAAFPKGNLYLKMRDELGTFYQDEDFKDLFSTRGQSAYSPWHGDSNGTESHYLPFKLNLIRQFRFITEFVNGVVLQIFPIQVIQS